MSASKPPSRPPTPWFVDAFTATYLEVYAHRDERDAAPAVEFLRHWLRLGPSTRLLDLGCGAGRHAHPLADVTGLVIGLDLSADLLAAATRRPTARNLHFVRADMRRIPIPTGSIDAAASLFTSFGYFDDVENAATVREIARVLRPNARVVLDVPNLEPTFRKLTPHSVEERGDYRIESHRAAKADTRRVEKRVTITSPGREAVSYTESVRLYSPNELDGLLAAASLRTVARMADFLGTPFDGESLRQVVVAELTANGGDQ